MDVEVGAMEVNQVIAVQAHPVLVMKGQEEYTVVACLCKVDFKLFEWKLLAGFLIFSAPFSLIFTRHLLQEALSRRPE